MVIRYSRWKIVPCRSIVPAMKRFLILAAMLAAPLMVSAADTAYTALRVYGKKEGEKALYRVVELVGSNGSPQPTKWKLVVDAPEARGGIREIEVQNGRIVSQRTPVARQVGAPMNFNQLNLDSDGAFTVVNQEAQKRRVPFDRLDYTLRGGSNAGAPMWEISLFQDAGKVGTMRIAADTGQVLEQDFSPPSRYADDRAYIDEDAAPAQRNRSREERYDEGDEDPTLRGFADRVGRHFQRRGRQIQNFFTGK